MTGMRTRALASLVALAMAAVASAACDMLTGPSSLTEAQIIGTWTLTSLQPTGQGSQNTPAGALYTLTLAEGKLSTRADCNSCAGQYTLSGKMLTAGPTLACTRAACATAAFETAYTSILGGESTVTATVTALTLTSSRGTLRFSR